MEALFDIIADLGFVSSVALVLWGMVLCARHGFGSDVADAQRAALGEGAFSEHWARVAMGA